jgi:predicted glycosyltransferase
MSAYKRFTDEQVVANIVEYMNKFPNASRYTVIKNCISSEERIRKLEKQGKVVLPKPQKRGEMWRRNFWIIPRETV